MAKRITKIHDCCGWVLDRKNLSPTVVEVHIEIQPRSAIDLYAALVASGLQLHSRIRTDDRQRPCMNRKMATEHSPNTLHRRKNRAGGLA